MGNIRTLNALVFAVDRGAGVLELIPVNDVGNDEIQAYFARDGALTTVAFTQEDAGRDGYKETARQPYKTLVVTGS